MYVGTILCQLALMSAMVAGKEEYSPHICFVFCIYVDKLSKMLNNVHVGCFVGTMLVNHLMYADDLVLLSPSAAGLSILLSICSTMESSMMSCITVRKVMFLYFVVNY